MTPAPRLSSSDAVAVVRSLASAGRRTVLGIVGCPGAGKSTLSDAIAADLGPLVVIVPMDGFHLANEVLERHGTRQRKGAPETFDAVGYLSLLARLRAQRPGDAPVYAPRYDRAASASIGGAIEVDSATPLVVTEGNYLLLDDAPWAGVRAELDECWFVEVDDAVRVPRLIARHIAFGKTPEAAEEWVMRSDEANAALVKRSAGRADRVVVIS